MGKELAKEGDSKTLKKVNRVLESDLGKVATVATTTQTWYKLLHDLMTKSYALFIGEIKIEINTGWDRYSFKANYDGNGMRIEEPKYKKAYLGRDMFTNLGNAKYDSEGENYMYSILGGGMKSDEKTRYNSSYSGNRNVFNIMQKG